MTAMELSGATRGLAATQPPPERARLFFSRNGRDNPFEFIPRAAYELPVWRQPTPFMSAYFVSDPTGLKQVLIDKVASYPKTELERRIFRALFGDGLLSSDTETWRAHRRIMAPSFDPRSVAGYADGMAQAAAKFADGWARHVGAAEVDVSAEMTQLALEIISETMFSGDAAAMTELTGAALQRSAEAAFSFNLLDVMPIVSRYRLARKERRMAEIFAPMDGGIRRLIEARRTDPGKRDLLGRLVAAMDEETGLKLSPQEVRDEVLTIFIAGHETTAAAMTFVWYVLSQQPDWEARLHAELDEVLGGRTPTQADLPKLTLARRIVEETMRLYPPAPGLSARAALADDEICGVPIRKGSVIIVSAWVLHRHRRLWSNPERFDPDRFLPERSAERPRLAYLPFGAGPRVCIGQQLAIAEATLILATLAQRYRLRLRLGFDVAIQHRVTIRPRDGLPMRLEQR
jgi:cytochrome P450